MQLSDEAVNAQLDAVGALLDGGKLLIFDGPRRSTYGDPIVQFDVSEVTAAAKGSIEISVAGVCLSKRDGTAKWYCFMSRGGRVVCTGDVGDEFEVTPSYLVNGTRAMVDRITIGVR